MLAVALLVGGIVVWLVVDPLLMWHKERQHRGPSVRREQGAGTTFHSSGFEHTHPPHELVDLRYG